jgi:hypothetical protein
MSRIALNGNPLGTGTFTIASPNSSTDRTLNLPDASGTLNTSGAPNVVPAGTVSAPSITTDGDTNTGIFFPAADTIAFAEGGAEAMRIDASGNLGLGVTPNAWGSGPAMQIGNLGIASRTSLPSLAQFSANQYWDGAAHRYIATNFATIYSQNVGAHSWGIAASGTAGDAISFTQAMTLDSSGNLLVNRTANTSTASQVAISYNANAGTIGLGIQATVQDIGTAVQFVNTSGAVCGTISQGTSTTAYNTSSDYRLKHDIQPMTGALAKVAQLKPVTYKWNADNSESQGFIAHELQEVVPECVTGEKDGVETYTDEDGVEQTRPRYQGIDTSFLVATLTAAIQELNAKVDAQAAEIAALKGQV